MTVRKTNVLSTKFVEDGPSERDPGVTGRQLDLSGVHLGVRIEEMDPGGTSSYHHYHTAEEEHVLVLGGHGTLHLGDEQIELVEGDHIWFPAGEDVAHHIENTSSEPFKFLVFGECKQEDVVFYPSGQVILVKSARGFHQYTYRERSVDTAVSENG